MSKKISICIFFATIHWIITFFTDPLIFNLDEANRKFYYFLKIIFGLCLLLVYQVIGNFCVKLFRKDSQARVRVCYAFCYFCILSVLLVLTWPGIWRTDEFGVLGNVVAVQIYWWQHFLTSFYYIFSYMLLPFPSGVIIVQIVLVSFLFGYIAQKLGERINLKAFGYLLLLPFSIPSVLLFQLYPMRIVLYTMIELAVLVFIFTCKKEFADMTLKECALLAGSNIVLANWRAEGIYYIIIIPLILVLMHGKAIKCKKFFAYILLVLFGHILVYSVQTAGIKNERNDAYEMTAYAQSLTPLVYQAYLENDTEGLANAEKVISVEQVVAATKEGAEGIDCFWSGYLTGKEYTKEEFQAFKKQYLKWIVKYPDVYFRERLNTFFTSYEQTKSTDNLYDSNNIQFVYFLQEFDGTDPLFPALRSKLICFAERREWTRIEVPILVMLFVFCYGVKRQKRVALVMLGPLIRIPLVFFTAPDNYFMYYYSMYVCGMVVLTYFIVQKIVTKKIHNKNIG